MGGRFPFPAVPDGWFAVMASEDLASGQVTALSCLERELVAFRDADGTPRVFDAHCPHLGAHLGFGGQVCDDGIVCPFHGWRFDGDGRLVEAPRLERAPRAATHAWEVGERNGRIFVWHHAHGEAPEYEIPTYRADGSEWTPWRTRSYQVRTHVQELTENIIDRSHFYQVHDMVPPDDDRFEVVFDGHSMTVDQSIKVTAVADTGFEVQTRTTTCGPGIVAVEVREGPLDMLTFITQTPLMDDLLFHEGPRRRAGDRVGVLAQRRGHQSPVHPGHTDLRTQDLPEPADAHEGRRTGRPLPSLVPALLLGMGSRTLDRRRPLTNEIASRTSSGALPGVKA